MDEESQLVNLVPAHHHWNMHMFFLFIPAIAFVLILTVLFTQTPKQYAAVTTGEEAVLGAEK